MRRIGSVESESSGRRLADHLLTLDISSKLIPAEDGKSWQVWVHQEDKVDQAQAELEQYLANPDDPKYAQVKERAEVLRREAVRVEREHRRQSHDVRYYWESRDLWRCPVTWGLIAASVMITFAANFGRNDPVSGILLYARFEVRSSSQVPLDRPVEGVVLDGVWLRSNPWEDLRKGEYWRVISPIFLHFHVLHLLFNMYWLYSLGTSIEIKKGSRRLGLLVLTSAVLSNSAQYFLTGDPRFAGMSGVDFALFGYVWMKGIYEPDLGLSLSRQTVLLMAMYLAVAISRRMPLAHVAHLSGLGWGILVALGPHLLISLKPNPEPD